MTEGDVTQVLRHLLTEPPRPWPPPSTPKSTLPPPAPVRVRGGRERSDMVFGHKIPNFLFKMYY